MSMPPNNLDFEAADALYQELIKEKEAKQNKPFPKTTPSTLPSLGGIKPDKPDAWSMCSFLSHIVRHGFSINLNSSIPFKTELLKTYKEISKD